MIRLALLAIFAALPAMADNSTSSTIAACVMAGNARAAEAIDWHAQAMDLQMELAKVRAELDKAKPRSSDVP